MRPEFLIATEQLELPQLDKAGPSLSDTWLQQLHWSTAYPEKLGQWEALRVLAECCPPISKDLFLEGLIGSRRMMSESDTLWWNIMILLSSTSPQPILSYHTLLSLWSLTFLHSPQLCPCLVLIIFFGDAQPSCGTLFTPTWYLGKILHNNRPLLKNEQVRLQKLQTADLTWLEKCISTENTQTETSEGKGRKRIGIHYGVYYVEQRLGCMQHWCIIAWGTVPTLLHLDIKYIEVWGFAKLPYYLHQSNGFSPCNEKTQKLKWKPSK